jgi:hypothetical protein
MTTIAFSIVRRAREWGARWRPSVAVVVCVNTIVLQGEPVADFDKNEKQVTR